MEISFLVAAINRECIFRVVGMARFVYFVVNRSW